MAVAALVAVAGCTGEPEPEPSVSVDVDDAPIRMQRVLEYDFNGATPMAEGARILDTGRYNLEGVLRLSGQVPMGLEPVPGPTEGTTAIQFPTPCGSKVEGECPKAVIEVPDSPLLNPGAAPFGWGANVLLTKTETSTGSNIMQKGFAVGGQSQWKLQVDNKAGYPSCLVVGTKPAEKFEALSDTSVADSKWHKLECLRNRSELILKIDGKEHASVAMPPGVLVEPPAAMRIGGKNIKADNDQFFGALQHVYVDIALP